MKGLESIRDRFLALRERDRRILLAGAAALFLLVVVGAILMPLQSAVGDAQARVQTRRDDLDWMQTNAPEIQAAGGGIMSQSTEPPIVLIDRTGREAGLAAAMRGAQPNGSNGVRVQLESAPFDALIAWLASVEQRYGLTLEAVTIDRAARPGLVNASVTFSQAKH